MKQYAKKEEYKKNGFFFFHCKIENCENKCAWETEAEGAELNQTYWALCEKHYNEHFNKEEEKTMEKFDLKDYKKSDFHKNGSDYAFCLNCKNLGIEFTLNNNFNLHALICKNCYDILKTESFKIIEGQTTCKELQDNFKDLNCKIIKLVNLNFEGFIYESVTLGTLLRAEQITLELLLTKKVLKFMAQGKLLVCIVED